MHEKHLYDYAVIRVVPKVEREEFVNVGLMLLLRMLIEHLKIRIC